MTDTRSLLILFLYALSLSFLVPRGYQTSIVWGSCAIFSFYLGFVHPLRRQAVLIKN